MDIDGFVLAGGASSRLGMPKARALVGDKSMLDRAVLALRAICGYVRVAGTLDGVTGLEFVADDPVFINGERVSASIIGLRTAISAAQTDWVAVLACDLPFVSGAVFKTLLERLFEMGSATYDAIVIEQSDGRLQPLVGIYRRQATLPLIAHAICTGALSLHSLLNALRLLTLPANAFGDDSERTFMNINTAADLVRARSAFRSE